MRPAVAVLVGVLLAGAQDDWPAVSHPAREWLAQAACDSNSTSPGDTRSRVSNKRVRLRLTKSQNYLVERRGCCPFLHRTNQDSFSDSGDENEYSVRGNEPAASRLPVYSQCVGCRIAAAAIMGSGGSSNTVPCGRTACCGTAW